MTLAEELERVISGSPVGLGTDEPGDDFVVDAETVALVEGELANLGELLDDIGWEDFELLAPEVIFSDADNRRFRWYLKAHPEKLNAETDRICDLLDEAHQRLVDYLEAHRARWDR